VNLAISKIKRLSTLNTIILVFSQAFQPVFAQESEKGATGVIEEIIVTATKRAVSIQEVPVSILAVEGDTLEQNAINDLAELSRNVPNLIIGDGLVTTAVSIRGMTPGMLEHGSNCGTGIHRVDDDSRMIVFKHPEHFICESLADAFDVFKIEFDVLEFFQVHQEATGFRSGNVLFTQQLHLDSAPGELVVELARSKFVENVFEFRPGIAANFDLNMGSFHKAATGYENVI
jgi:hypothetical protein